MMEPNANHVSTPLRESSDLPLVTLPSSSHNSYEMVPKHPNASKVTELNTDKSTIKHHVSKADLNNYNHEYMEPQNSTSTVTSQDANRTTSTHINQEMGYCNYTNYITCIPDKVRIKLYENDDDFTHKQAKVSHSKSTSEQTNMKAGVKAKARTKKDRNEPTDVKIEVKDITEDVYSEIYTISTQQQDTPVPHNMTRRNSCKRIACAVGIVLLVLCVCTGVGYGVWSQSYPPALTPTVHITHYTTEQPTFWMELHNASAEGNLTWVQYLLDQGANIDIVDDLNETPLYKAIKHKHLDVVKKLLENGADLNWRAGSNKYPFNFAAKVDQDIGKYLYDNGAKFFPVEDNF